MEKFQNLEQLRAKNALKASNDATFSGKANGEVVKKVPAMIQQNGMLAALAFAAETKKKAKLKNMGHALVFASIFLHCSDRGLVSIPTQNTLKTLETNDIALKNLLDEMCRKLSNCDSATLRNVTSESIAYLGYLRRFACKDSE